MMKRFINTSKVYLYFAVFGILLTLAISLTLPNYFVNKTTEQQATPVRAAGQGLGTPPSGPIPATLFGMHTLYATDWPTVPFGNLSKWGVTSWPDIEKTQGVYDWSKLDEGVNLAQSHGLPTFYTFTYAPSWAVTDQSTCFDSGYGWKRCKGAPNPTMLKNFTTALATRYKGKIQMYTSLQ